MNSVKYVSALLLLFLFVSLGFSQEATIVLNTEEIGIHQRPLVRFSHESHEALIECARCHHDYDKYGFNVGAEGQRCADCHTQAPGKNRVPLVDAFHIQCKSCHSDLMDRGEANLPVMCGQCHTR